MNENDIEQYSPGKSVLLHLLPGFLIGVCYFALVPVARQLEYPSIAALMITVLVVLVPFELGFLFYQGRNATGRFSLQGVVHYRNRLPVWQYLLWVPVLFVLLAIIFTVMRPVDVFLRDNFFSWIQSLNGGLDGSYSQQALIVTYVLVGVFGVIVGPTVEEMYFRGYLLPRMGYAGVYNRQTQLLEDARAAGAVAIDGVMMLVHQGAKALQIWTGKKAPVDVMERAVREALSARRARRDGA